MIETLAVTLIAIGVLFDIFGCIGLVRLPTSTIAFNRPPSA